MQRGVFQVDYRSPSGHPIIAAFTRDGRRVFEAVVTDEAQRPGLIAAARAALETVDPPARQLHAV